MKSRTILSCFLIAFIAGTCVGAEQTSETRLLFQKIDLSVPGQKTAENPGKAQSPPSPLFVAGIGFTGLPSSGGPALPTFKYHLKPNVNVAGGASFIGSTLSLLAMCTYRIKDAGPNSLTAGAAVVFSGVNTLSGLIGCETRINGDLELGFYIVPVSIGSGQFMGILNNAFVTAHFFI